MSTQDTARAPQAETDQHPDNKAVDRFAARMKWKLGQKRRQGRSGWQDRAWTPEMISQALREHVNKGDPLDVANYCMFLAARNEPITPAPAPLALTDADRLDAERYRRVRDDPNFAVLKTSAWEEAPPPEAKGWQEKHGTYLDAALDAASAGGEG